MINCIILHGCPPNAKETMDPNRINHAKHWIPWTRDQLIQKGIPTVEKPAIVERLLREGATRVFINWHDITINTIQQKEGARTHHETRSPRIERL